MKARRLRREMTLPEVQLWQALRGNGLGGRRVLDKDTRDDVMATIAAALEQF